MIPGTAFLPGDRGTFRISVANIDATTPSNGTVQARVRGGRAHDNLTLNVRQPAGVCLSLPCGVLIDALIDGGLAGRGGGQIGAGVLMAPIEPFIAAAATYPAQSEATTVTP